MLIFDRYVLFHDESLLPGILQYLFIQEINKSFGPVAQPPVAIDCGRVFFLYVRVEQPFDKVVAKQFTVVDDFLRDIDDVGTDVKFYKQKHSSLLSKTVFDGAAILLAVFVADIHVDHLAAHMGIESHGFSIVG